MIKINLLPEEYRLVETRKRSFSPQKILFSAFFFVLVASLYQFFVYANIRQRIHQLDLETAQLSEPSKEVEQLDQAINTKLVPEKSFLNQYVVPNFLVAEVLNVLSDALPESVWLSELNIRRDDGGIRLDVTGYSRITSKQIAVAQIQEYMNSVKTKLEEFFLEKDPASAEKKQDKDKIFFKEVKAILTTNLREISGAEAMQFTASFQSSQNIKTTKK
jgi:Tfp pilus assembly protein PilN